MPVFFEAEKNKLDIFIKHPKYEARPLEMASGAEKTLAAIAIPRMVATADEAKIKACNTNVDLINSQIEAYLVQTSTAAANFLFNRLTLEI